MSSADETHNQPGQTHDEQAAHGGGAGGHDDGGHPPTAREFIKEDSLQDKALAILAGLVACGLVFMMFTWWTAPIKYASEEKAAPAVPVERSGTTTPQDAAHSEPGTRNDAPVTQSN